MEKMLQTQRLYLRNFRMEDAALIYAYRNDRRCYAYQRWENTSMRAVQAFVAAFGADIFLSGKEEQHYAICAGEALAGDLACFHTKKDNCITLGITIAPEHQRKGYGFELLQAVTEALRQRYPGMDIVALIEPENRASIALFEKLGFVRECYAEQVASYIYILKGKTEETVFYGTQDLKDGEICLRLERTCGARPEKRWLPAYYFDICLPGGEKIGSCDLRIGHNERTYIGGNIGYRIEAPYRGHHYAAKACALLFRQARKHGMDHLFISCFPDNTASARTCELAGGHFLETAAIPEDDELYADGERAVKIYRFSL